LIKKYDFDDMLIVPHYERTILKSRQDVNLKVSITFKYSNRKWRGVPIVAANLDTLGTFEVADVLNKSHISTCISKHVDIKTWVKNEKGLFLNDIGYLWYSTGINDEDLQKLFQWYELYQNWINPFVCIDVANGYSSNVLDKVESIRKRIPKATLVVGNVVTRDMIRNLDDVGVDIVKVGIGSGSLCTTRLKTGIGYPQASAIMECADVAHECGIHIISDGGCKTPGDVAKAFACGADFVMLGGMLSGTDETEGDTIIEYEKTNKFTYNFDRDENNIIEEHRYKIAYGMASKIAVEKYNGGLQDYRSSEGRVVKVPYKGPIEEVLKDILGGLRSAMLYTSSSNLKEFYQNSDLIEVTNTHNRMYTDYEIK